MLMLYFDDECTGANTLCFVAAECMMSSIEVRALHDKMSSSSMKPKKFAVVCKQLAQLRIANSSHG